MDDEDDDAEHDDGEDKAAVDRLEVRHLSDRVMARLGRGTVATVHGFTTTKRSPDVT